MHYIPKFEAVHQGNARADDRLSKISDESHNLVPALPGEVYLWPLVRLGCRIAGYLLDSDILLRFDKNYFYIFLLLVSSVNYFLYFFGKQSV